MLKISPEHIARSYEIAKLIFHNKITHKEGLNELVRSGMNRNSASDYVYNYQCMRKGKLMTRNASILGTKYFLQKIYEEEGKEGLNNALISLSLHLDYYENISGSRVISRRKVYEEYLSIIQNSSTIVYPDDIDSDQKFIEGKSKKISVNVFERNPAARAKCIEHYGCECQICSLKFEDKYGVIGKDFIHVHHIIEISSVGAEYELDAIKDLVPVCPNCHAMLHKRQPAYSISEIKEILRSNSN